MITLGKTTLKLPFLVNELRKNGATIFGSMAIIEAIKYVHKVPCHVMDKIMWPGDLDLSVPNTEENKNLIGTGHYFHSDYIDSKSIKLQQFDCLHSMVVQLSISKKDIMTKAKEFDLIHTEVYIDGEDNIIISKEALRAIEELKVKVSGKGKYLNYVNKRIEKYLKVFSQVRAYLDQNNAK